MNLDLALKVGGRSNESPLTPLGIQQAQALGKHFATVSRHKGPLGPVFTSTAVRTMDTAKIALEAMGAPTHPMVHTEQLLELSQGEWEGKLRTLCYTPEVTAVIEKDPWNFAAPGGESQHEVEKRMVAFLRDYVLPACKAGGPPAVVVTHGLAIKCVLRHILNSSPAMSRHIWTENTSVTELVYAGHHSDDSRRWVLRRVNDIVHLHMEGLVEN